MNSTMFFVVDDGQLEVGKGRTRESAIRAAKRWYPNVEAELEKGNLKVVEAKEEHLDLWLKRAVRKSFKKGE